jgi:hypothetical protein
VHGAHRDARDLRVLGAAYMIVLLAAVWPASTWAMARGARRTRPTTWAAVLDQLAGRDGLLRGAMSNLTALARVDFHPFDRHDPRPVLDRMRDAAVDAAWERPVREPSTDGVAPPPEVCPLTPRDLANLVRFAGFATARTARFLRAAS